MPIFYTVLISVAAKLCCVNELRDRALIRARNVVPQA